MSLKSARAFIDKIKTDVEFMKKATACKDTNTWTTFLKDEQFDFTSEELNSLQTELSDEELEAVAGGISTRMRPGQFL